MSVPSRERQLIGNVWQYRTADEGGGGGSGPLKRVHESVGFADFDGAGVSSTVYTLAPGEQLLFTGLYPTEAFNDTGFPNLQLYDASLSVALCDATDCVVLPVPSGGLISLFGADLGADWGVAKPIVQPDTVAVDLVLWANGSWNGDGSTGVAEVFMWVWSP